MDYFPFNVQQNVYEYYYFGVWISEDWISDFLLYIHTYIHMYIHMYIHTYIHTYIHMYIHTYIYIHTCALSAMYIHISLVVYGKSA